MPISSQTRIVHQDDIDERSKHSLKSTWTPLANENYNKKLYVERRQLVNKWFDTWTTRQRQMLLEDLLIISRRSERTFAREWLNAFVPRTRMDFTQTLPRCISIYIFSFLDPKSLACCAQVNSHWKHLSESDSLWRPICVRKNWVLPFALTPFENGAWKRMYAENIRISLIELDSMITREALMDEEKRKAKLAEENRQIREYNQIIRNSFMLNTKNTEIQRPPWRPNCKKPDDIHIHKKPHVKLKVNRTSSRPISGRIRSTPTPTKQMDLFNEYLSGDAYSVNREICSRPDWARTTADEAAEMFLTSSQHQKPPPFLPTKIERFHLTKNYIDYVNTEDKKSDTDVEDFINANRITPKCESLSNTQSENEKRTESEIDMLRHKFDKTKKSRVDSGMKKTNKTVDQKKKMKRVFVNISTVNQIAKKPQRVKENVESSQQKEKEKLQEKRKKIVFKLLEDTTKLNTPPITKRVMSPRPIIKKPALIEEKVKDKTEESGIDVNEITTLPTMTTLDERPSNVSEKTETSLPLSTNTLSSTEELTETKTLDDDSFRTESESDGDSP
ncbi:hypothetical protein SNEBB_001819 [Seison nebaliae]|nr:hypothetical protein SNEBB_001819 [Seison nebaliae]